MKSKDYKVVKLHDGKSASSVLFVPGGPGMSSFCFKKFAKKYLSKFTVRAIEFSGEGRVSRNQWSLHLKEALRNFPSDILIGHSFGGMLLLSTTGLHKLVKYQVVLSAAPDMSWRKNATNIHLTESETRKVIEAESRFEKISSSDNLKRLWAAWAPYYFSKTRKANGMRWLYSQKYFLKAYKSSPELLKNYRMRKSLNRNLLLVGGEQDKLTPISDFSAILGSKIYRNQCKMIPRAGHFIWIDAPRRLALELNKFVKL